LADDVLVDSHVNALTLHGQIIGTSDIPSTVTASSLYLYSRNSLLVDNNVILPGVNTVFCSPLWVISGQRLINLRGQDGNSHYSPRASEGNNGLPGLPGRNGGNFYGILSEFHNIPGLSIDVSGGTGGPGQAGGDGVPGTDGVEGNEEDVKNKMKAGKKRTLERGFFQWFVTANDSQEITINSGEPAKPGGNAGVGGKGGFGGRAATVRFSILEDGFSPLKPWKPLPFLVRNVEGQNGRDGDHGTPGTGGINRTVYEGIYLHKERNIWELGKRVVADGAAGAAVGAGATSGIASVAAWIGSIGGPVGSAVAYVGTVGAGAIAGGVTGAISPIIGSEIDKALPEWVKKPEALVQASRAPDGKVSGFANNGQDPEKLSPIEYDKVDEFWWSLKTNEVSKTYHTTYCSSLSPVT
jgi:hypothetical protein